MPARAVLQPCRVAVLLTLAVALGSCAPVHEPPPSIVLVTLCSFRVDRLAAAGHSPGLMPFVDRLAAEGVFFEHAVSASSWTKPSTTSLLTGLTPNVHGLVDYYPLDALEQGAIPNPRVLGDQFVTLPEALLAAGYRTGCRVNNLHAGEFFRLTQGCEDTVTRRQARTRDMVADLGGFLRAVPRGQPFFFHLFSRDAHTPYQPGIEDYRRLHGAGGPPTQGELDELRRQTDRAVRALVRKRQEVPPDQVRTWVDLYEAQLPEIDRALAQLPEILAAAGRLDETLLVLTADHGERLLEDGSLGHGGPLDEAVLRVPLIVWGHGIAGGRRATALVRSIDILPTLLAAAGAPPSEVAQGQNLWPYLHAKAPLPTISAFSSFNGVDHALRQGTLKLRLTPPGRPQLFDLAADPFEKRDLYALRRGEARALEAELARWLAAERELAARLGGSSSRSLDAAAIDELKALGYL